MTRSRKKQTGPCSQLRLPILSVQEIVGRTSLLEEGLQRAGLRRPGSGSVSGREDPSFGRSPACPMAGSRARLFRQEKPPLGKKDTEFPRTTWVLLPASLLSCAHRPGTERRDPPPPNHSPLLPPALPAGRPQGIGSDAISRTLSSSLCRDRLARRHTQPVISGGWKCRAWGSEGAPVNPHPTRPAGLSRFPRALLPSCPLRTGQAHFLAESASGWEGNTWMREGWSRGEEESIVPWAGVGGGSLGGM